MNRPNLDFRGFAGTIASGSIGQGDEVVVAKSGKASRVKRIVTHGGDLARAVEGQAVTLVLEDEVEVSRGNMLVSPGARPHVADQFAANIVWFDENALIPGRSYLIRTETDQASATVTDLKYRIDVNSFAHEAASELDMNEVGVCEISTQAPIAFDAFAENRATGSFILIDRITNATVGAGMFLHPLRRAANIHWQALEVDKQARAAQKGQRPAVLWFTGLSGSGKSTIANLLEKKLHAAGKHTYILDGDNVRHGLNRDLGFTEADRVENIRRVAEVARLMADAGLIVLVSFISPFRAERRLAREIMAQGEFVEVFVDTPFEECARRDPKGLYAKALNGEIKNFTGLDSPYEAPENPEIHLRDTRQVSRGDGRCSRNMASRARQCRTGIRQRRRHLTIPGIAALFERLALDTGKLIMDVYASDMVVDTKSDLSPVTVADRASEKLILEGLRGALPDIPCVAEEEIAAGHVPCALGEAFLLIDPLDGTREFVNRRADFTVNIALVRDGAPAIGVVFAPARGADVFRLAGPCRGDHDRRGVRDRKPPKDTCAHRLHATHHRRQPVAPDARHRPLHPPFPGGRDRLGRLVAEIRHDRQRRGRSLPALRHDDGMGHGGRRRGAAGCGRHDDDARRAAADLRQARPRRRRRLRQPDLHREGPDRGMTWGHRGGRPVLPPDVSNAGTGLKPHVGMRRPSRGRSSKLWSPSK